MAKTKIYSTPIIVGVVVIVFFLALEYFSPIKGDGGQLLGGTLSIILRIASCYWISDIARQQGRKGLPFILLAVLIPAITLIIIGLLGDKKEKTNHNKS